MPTIKDLASQAGIQPESVKKKLNRKGFQFGLNDDLTEDAIAIVLGQGKQDKTRQDKAAPPVQPAQSPRKTIKPIQKIEAKPVSGSSWEKALAVAPLPMLGLAASYGVFYFAAFFAPVWVAIGEAMAFELTYIGLSITKGLTDKQQARAAMVAKGAVLVSIIYNSLAGVMHLQPDWFKQMNAVWVWVLACVHGLPLALLAYQVATLLLHRKN